MSYKNNTVLELINLCGLLGSGVISCNSTNVRRSRLLSFGSIATPFVGDGSQDDGRTLDDGCGDGWLIRLDGCGYDEFCKVDFCNALIDSYGGDGSEVNDAIRFGLTVVAEM